MSIRILFLCSSLCFLLASWSSGQITHTVTVESSRGANSVAPPVGVNTVVHGEVVTFRASPVYLDDRLSELTTNPDNIRAAYYRAVPVAYSIDGSPQVQLSGSTVATIPINQDVRFTWVWELEMGLFVESGVGDDQQGGADAAPAIGKHWFKKDEVVSFGIDRTITNEAERANLVSYTLENERLPDPDTYLELNQGFYVEDLVGNNPEIPVFSQGQGITVEYWGLRRPGFPGFEFYAGNNEFFDESFAVGFDPNFAGGAIARVQIYYDGGTQIIDAVVPADFTADSVWHHWAIVYTNNRVQGTPDVLEVYRDGVLVATNTRLVHSGLLGQDFGTRPVLALGLFEDQLPQGQVGGFGVGESAFNTMRFWNRALTRDQLDFASQHIQLKSGAVALPDDLLPTDIQSEYSFDGQSQPFTLPGATFPTEFREIRGTQEVGIPDLPGDRFDTLQVVMDDWKRITWNWQGEVRYRFDALNAQLPLTAEAFIQVHGRDQIPLVADVTNFSDWVPLGSTVDVGCFYRTEDRCLTAGNFVSGPTGDLPNSLSIDRWVDTTIGGRVARVYTVDAVTSPSEIHWNFSPTVFRAEVPLGEAFDPSNANLRLVPDLCVGALLRRGAQGPGGIAAQQLNPRGRPGTGAALRWDQVGELLYPVHPGSFQFDWPDASSNEAYKIEIVTGFPADTVPLESACREQEDGARETTDTDTGNPYLDNDGNHVVDGGTGNPLYFIKETSLDATGAEYPATPGAHYRHLSDSAAGRQAPTMLDSDATDQWFFKEMPYTTSPRAGVSEQNTPQARFHSFDPSNSVLLFSYRPNPDEIADGSVSFERLAVRVVRSENVVQQEERAIALRLRVLELDDEAVRLQPLPNLGPGQQTQEIPLATSHAEANFSVDFWLNSRQLRGAEETFSLLRFGATSGGDPKFDITIDPAEGTLNASYFGISALSNLSVGQTGWQHCTVQVRQGAVGQIGATFLTVSIDGVPVTTSVVNATLSQDSVEILATKIPQASDFVLGPVPAPLQIDQLRVLDYVSNARLSDAEIDTLRQGRVLDAGFRNGLQPVLLFDFETTPTADGFIDQATGQVRLDGPGFDAPVIPHAQVNLQEVATQLRSTFDKSNFGSGFILNEASNYNSNLYDRSAAVGAWGPIFPVNHGDLFLSVDRRLEVAYYENPSLLYPGSNAFLHPNVDWPYVAVAYDDVVYPVDGKDKDKAIYIASRIGSEGVDQQGHLQEVFDRASYEGLAIYNQPERALAGFNPNEEHALVVPSNRPAVRVKMPEEALFNDPPLAAFALQGGVNQTDLNSIATYTSDPWVLVEVQNTATGEPEMAAYQVFETRMGGVPFPRPDDALVGNTPGLSYESAPVVEDRFLLTDPAQTFDFSYQFDYPAFAGDLLIAPYPLNIVIGNSTMLDARGANIQLGNGVNQRALWRDVNHNAWIVSGGGQFFHQYFYPYRADFYLPNTPVGTPVSWLPEAGTPFTGSGNVPQPRKVRYRTFWRSDYPKLKRGETLTYQGGEYFNENPGSNGLPALVAMAAAEIIYDSGTPSMVIQNAAGQNAYNPDDYTARVMRPLDRREWSFSAAEMEVAGFTPADQDKVFVVAERWYLKELPGSLQRRFYFDSLAEKLVFRGYLNGKDSGDPELAAGPDPINILEPNVLTKDEFDKLSALSPDAAWKAAMSGIFLAAQNPGSVANGGENESSPVFLSGLRVVPSGYGQSASGLEANTFWQNDLSSTVDGLPDPDALALDSLGVGSSLVTNPDLLTRPAGSEFITIAENNRSELNGAPVSLHIIEIVPDRYRGALQVIEAADAFSEKITVQHNGEFGANTDELYYEWWIRDAAPLDVVAGEINADGTLQTTDSEGRTLWQEYLPRARAEDNSLTPDQKRRGLHSIVFEGSPTVTLSDKLILMRYRHQSELNWSLVPFEITDPATEWAPGDPAPFQWAGAANSPQPQADGSKRYIPQLVMGWVKRVLDRINPYEARYTDFFSNESPAVYSSQIQIAGGPFAGAVALNPDKNVIENTGLIELYETVLQRARQLSIDNSEPVGNSAINQALLLAATRLAVLYELLGHEAYSDAQDPTIRIGTDIIADAQLASATSFTHAFQNQEADVLHEELALLRGSDFRKSFPVFNRMMWNYVKGLGEAAYNVNYNIYDENKDGFINEDDARALYPQGHGDSWGHFLSALDKHYVLLQHPVFEWEARPELYSLMQNVIEADYLDEKTFAKLAAGKARAGRDIVRGTYRLHYTQDPDGQWQGYSDGVDKARAWGVSEWASRAGHGAYFDWMVANAILPENAEDASAVGDPENLDALERLTAEDEIGEIAASLLEIQIAMDDANGGGNPLGFDSEAIAFDLDPTFLQVGSETQGSTHFEQIYDRAVVAGENAMATLEFATREDQKLRRIADDADAVILEALRHDLDSRNRLIEIFGRPYEGTIGVGKIYPEGYEGPDVLLYSYLDRESIDQIVPPVSNPAETGGTVVSGNSLLSVIEPSVIHFDYVQDLAMGVADHPSMIGLFNEVNGSPVGVPSRIAEMFRALSGESTYRFENGLDLPVVGASAYAFQAPEGEWGRRASYGQVQRNLEQMLVAEIELRRASFEYIAVLRDFQMRTQRLLDEMDLIDDGARFKNEMVAVRASLGTAIVAAETSSDLAKQLVELQVDITDAVGEALPTAVGTSNDATAPARGAIKLLGTFGQNAARLASVLATTTAGTLTLAREETLFALNRQLVRAEIISDLEDMIVELVHIAGKEQPTRDAIGSAYQELEISRQNYVSSVARGFRLMKEREVFNKALAASVQKDRYEDMVLRLSRNEAMTKYQSAFDHAARYTWLAAKAYDYETSLDPGNAAAAGPSLDKIVKTRQLGLWSNGAPQIGKGGLAEILAQLKGNFGVLESQLGINSFQNEIDKLSLRRELFRIGAPQADGGTFSSDQRWRGALMSRAVADLRTIPEFARYCRPFAPEEDGPQPGIVIRFASHIEPGLNFFGNPLAAGDHTFSVANFATKIGAHGVWLEMDNPAGLSATPRGYLVPVGTDFLRVSSANEPITRSWSVLDQRVPTPFTINSSDLTSPGFIPSLDGVDGSFSEPRRYGDFRIYHNNGDALDETELVGDTRLIGRSVWNSQWLLIIPGASLHADPDEGVERFINGMPDDSPGGRDLNGVDDILLHFMTYSHNGQ